MTAIETLRKHLEKYGQEHLIKFWDEIDDEQRRQLKQEIDELNFSELQSFFERVTKSNESENEEKLDDKLQPIEESQFLSIRRTSPFLIKKYEMEGLSHIAAGHVGVLLMAGGQGTRLGFSHPKGMYDVGLPSKKSLFQIQAERIRTLQRLATQQTGKTDGRITWYIMTSEHTMEPTKAFFEQHNYFGLNASDVIMFEQGSLPCFGFDGKILLNEKHVISKAPDGNGGIYRALKSQGILNDMERRGVLYLHAHSVDNILIKVADPVFIGYCVQQEADCAAKVVEKSQPNEAVGVICVVDGKYQVVEYSEISTKTSELRNLDGRLTFNAGNICNHFFSTEFLNKIGNKFEKSLKLHVAKKKIPFIDNAGKRCTPEKPNGIKIEKFVFDVFEFAEKFVVLAVEREEEFSPLKNADSAGKECATTARKDIYRCHKKLIEAAGGNVDGDGVCEISSLLSYSGEGLKEIVNGQTFTPPIYLKSNEEVHKTTNGYGH
ncbi:UDP-N-acetylhexosamine pyrophosphorylase [Sitodiplosis mosellana]|uniref:UDP-N-acetylhexosamine pyrophosphorylase n=1 Tax=Sitodiplosis mosellana TaxID=263140 RepID=UPI0024441F05|nr:UDP-N-acetylhexosamine pyrophosphorylase [Sitodiplosis mosellana]